jgi:hypothetical protein
MHGASACSVLSRLCSAASVIRVSLVRPSRILATVLLCACRGSSAIAPADSGATGNVSDCDPSARHDASGFEYTATCAFATDDAGVPAGCQEWWEGADGDWTPFLVSCLDAGGTITTVPCADAGLGGTCALAATCVEQTRLFFYGDAATLAGAQACALSGGAAFSP